MREGLATRDSNHSTWIYIYNSIRISMSLTFKSGQSCRHLSNSISANCWGLVCILSISMPWRVVLKTQWPDLVYSVLVLKRNRLRQKEDVTWPLDHAHKYWIFYSLLEQWTRRAGGVVAMKMVLLEKLMEKLLSKLKKNNKN